ncbi:unnamed protein product [Gongylonema pulchrum]|uniref:Protein kinase domain-containing protein n=1 Tax=Gongylonema pulchrum TaxID=637853 RepID=A0A183DDT2_9BILA|nr:unnamed protein product [Gongylonema pulchrum]
MATIESPTPSTNKTLECCDEQWPNNKDEYDLEELIGLGSAAVVYKACFMFCT